jgi:hypothetical protein
MDALGIKTARMEASIELADPFVAALMNFLHVSEIPTTFFLARGFRAFSCTLSWRFFQQSASCLTICNLSSVLYRRQTDGR